jgi:hypothetical protein
MPRAMLLQQPVGQPGQRQQQRQQPQRRAVQPPLGHEQHAQEQAAHRADERAHQHGQHQPLHHGGKHDQWFGGVKATHAKTPE